MKHAGEWFLPGSNLKLSGRLIFEDANKKIFLELFGNRFLDGEPVISNLKRDKRYNSKNFNDSFKKFHSIILGDAHGYVTLYNCHWSGTEDVGKDIYILKYRVEFVFFGAHINTIEQPLVESATFIFPYLSSWFDGWESINKLEMFKNAEFSFSDNINNEQTATPLNIKQGFTLIMYDKYTKLMREIGVHHEVKYQKFVKFQYEKPVCFKDMLVDVNIFSKLLEFSLGKPLKKMITEIEVNSNCLILYNKIFNNQSFIRLPVGNFSLFKAEDVKKHSQHQNYMLLSNWIMESEELQAVIKKWYSNESFYNIYDLYLDSNNWLQNSEAMLSNVMFNNRFLNIIQGLEAYYKKVLEQLKSVEKDFVTEKNDFDNKKKEILSVLQKNNSPELTKWFNSKFNYKQPKPTLQPKIETILTQVIESLNEILIPIFGKNDIVAFFPKFASKIRDDLSHGLNKKTSQGKELNPFFQMGQILLAICILKTLEIKDIIDKVIHYDTFSRYIYEIKRSKLVFK